MNNKFQLTYFLVILFICISLFILITVSRTKSKNKYKLLCPKDDITLTNFNMKKNFLGGREDRLIYSENLIIPLSSELIENINSYSDWAAREKSSQERLWMVKFPYSLEKQVNNDTIYVYKYSQEDTFKLKFLIETCNEDVRRRLL